MPIMEDLAGFKAAYGPWLERQRPLLEQKNWKEAFVGYPYVQNAACPFARMSKPLAQCRIGLFSTAGLYIEGEQEPFDAENYEGDWRHAELPLDAPRERLRIAHTHFDHKVAEADLNSVFPVDRLRELEHEGRIGALAPRAVAISGYCTRADLIAERTAPAVVEAFKRQDVDAVLFVPV